LPRPRGVPVLQEGDGVGVGTLLRSEHAGGAVLAEQRVLDVGRGDQFHRT
jgi:hypothetical protein